MFRFLFATVLAILLMIPCSAQACQGMCGDFNNDGKVNVSDAVSQINYTFSGGNPPEPVLACGDSNSDARVALSDAVYIINYVFSGGNPPGDCSPGRWESMGGDCCTFVLK